MTTTEDMTIKGPVGDLRHEKIRRVSPQFSGRIAPAIPVPSPNLAAFVAMLEPEGKLGKLRPLADRIEDGHATETEEEITTVYDNFSMLLNVIEDLVGMCRRREEALAQCDVRVGSYS